MTVVLCLLTWAYFVLAVASFAGAGVPFEVFVWGGLILFLGWWAHDAIYERQARRVVA